MPAPAELKERPQWVVWRMEERGGKPTKVPYRPDGHGLAAVDRPETWGPVTAAWRTAAGGDFAGCGFVVTTDDPYCGVDLDHCRDDATGAVEPWALELVRRLDSYTEITPSRTGLRVWIKGRMPGPRNRKGSVEIYDHKRYFTVTGDHLLGTPDDISDRQEQLEQLYRELFPAPAVKSPAPTPPSMGAYEVLERARKARNGERVDALMRGDLSGHGSGSEADLALVSHLAFWTRDEVVIEQILRMSALWDEKWERADYRERTIARGLELTTEAYDPERAGGEVRRSGSTRAAEPEPAPDPKAWLTPLSDLLLQPDVEVDWLVDELLITGGVCLFGAKPKVGKTTLLHQLALAIARGERFLGRKTRQGPVIYLALEEDRSRVVARFRALGAREGDPVHVLVGQAPQEALGALRQAIDTTGAIAVIIDPIQRLTRLENINDYSEVSNATDPFIGLARSTGCAVIFSHHLGKQVREGGDQILGSTALFGSVDTAVLIRRHEDQSRTLETIQRYGNDWEAVLLGHSEETGASWVAGKVDSVMSDKEHRAVLEVLANQVEPIAHRALLEVLPMRWQDAQKALAQLVYAGKVERLGTGRKGDSYRYRIPLRVVAPAPDLTHGVRQNPDSLPYSNGFIAERGNESGNETGNERAFLISSDSLPPVGAGNESAAGGSAGGASDDELAFVEQLDCPRCGGQDYEPLGFGRRRCLACRQAWGGRRVVEDDG